MSDVFARCVWSRAELGRAVELVVRASGFTRTRQMRALEVDATADAARSLGQQIEFAVAPLELEVEPRGVLYGELDRLLWQVCPALLDAADNQRSEFIVLLARRWRKLVLLAPDGTRQAVSPQQVRRWLCRTQESPLIAEMQSLLGRVGIEPNQRARAQDAILRERLKTLWVENIWQLRPSPGTSFWRQLQRARMHWLLLGFVASYVLLYVGWFLLWGNLGSIVIAKNADLNAIAVLVLLIFILVPFRLAAPWFYGTLSIRVGELVKRRLLYGALRLEPEEIRHQGTGQLLGRVIESEAIESQALDGSAFVFMGLIELVMTIPILIVGAGGWSQALVLAVWVGLTLVVAWQYYQARSQWTRARMGITHDLVEQMVGYRTRLAQQSCEEWHRDEERALDEYHTLAEKMDCRMALLKSVMPRGWSVVGLLGLHIRKLKGSDGGYLRIEQCRSSA